MAKFEKGNPGKPKGAKNKSSKLGQAKIAKYLDDGGYDTLIEEIEQLEPKDKVQAIIKLIEFVVPKQKAVEHKGDSTLGTISVNFQSTHVPPITSENDMFDDD